MTFLFLRCLFEGYGGVGRGFTSPPSLLWGPPICFLFLSSFTGPPLSLLLVSSAPPLSDRIPASAVPHLLCYIIVLPRNCFIAAWLSTLTCSPGRLWQLLQGRKSHGTARAGLLPTTALRGPTRHGNSTVRFFIVPPIPLQHFIIQGESEKERRGTQIAQSALV